MIDRTRFFFLLLLLLTLTCHSGRSLRAQTLIWDANTTGAGQPNGSGQWLGTNQWWDGAANVNWNNGGTAIAQMGVTGSTLVSPNTVTITGGTANAAGINFSGFTAAPGTGQQYTIAGSSGTLNLGTGGVIQAADLSSSGSNFITFASTLLVTGNGLTIQKSGGTAQQFMRFDMASNPGLTGVLTIKGNNGGLFFRSGAPGTFAAMSGVVVETDSCFSIVGGGTYALPMSIAGTGGNGQYGAIRVDTSNTTISGNITLTADAKIQTNTGGITGTVVSGIISGGFGFGRFATGSGAGTFSLTNANTYTGTTTLGHSGAFAGGVTILDFTAGTAPASDILYNSVGTAGALNLIGGNNSSTVLNLNGKAGTVNTQRFGNVTLNTAGAAFGGTSVISLVSGAGGSMSASLGTITRSSTVATLAFNAPASGTITTTQADGFLGPWATYRTAAGNMTWAAVSGGTVGAFTSTLPHVTGTAISALPGYSTAGHLDIASTSAGNVTVSGATTNLATVTMSDHCFDRVMDLAGQTLRLGTGTPSVGGVLLAGDARNLTIGISGSAGTLTSGGPADNTAGQLFLTNGSNTSTLTVNSNITNNGSGAVTLFVNGNTGSKVVLAGTNTYTGGTNLLSGTVEMKTAAALGSSGTLTVAEGAAIQLGGGITVARTATMAGTGVSNTGVLRNTAGSNSWTGTITVNAPLRIQSDAGTLTLTHSGGAASNMFTGTHNLVFGGSGNIVLGSRLNTSSGTVTKDGTGTLTVSGDGGTALTGATTISGGVLRLASANGLGTTSAITVSDVAVGAALELSGGITTPYAITFNGSGINGGASGGTNINGMGAIRNSSGSNNLSGTLSIGLDAAGPRISADAGTVLTISGTLRSGGSLAGTRIGLLGGAGTINVTGAITNGTTPATFITGIAKIESGTVNLRSASSFTPNTATPTTVLVNVRGGTLNFEFANATPAGALVPSSNNLGLGGGVLAQGGTSLGGGTLLITGKDSTVNTQNFAGTTLAGGRSAITLASGTGGTVNMAMGPITRGNSSGSVVDITLPASGTLSTTTTNTNGILNGGMTVGKTTWATSAATSTASVAWVNTGDTITLPGYSNGQQVSFTGTAPGGLTAGVGYYVVNATGANFQVAATEGGTALALSDDGSAATVLTGGAITGLAGAGYSATFAANANVDVAGGAVTQGAITTNSLRFNAAAGTTLSLSGTLTNASGGILVTPNVTGNVTIQSTTATVRTLSSSTPSDFTVHHHGSGTLTFASTISLTNAIGFTKTGTGTMTFAGTTGSAGVQIRATEGTLNFTASNQFTSGTDPTLFLGSASTSAKVSFGNGASTGAETLAAIYVLGSGSSLVGNGSALYTLGLQSGGTTDLRLLTIGGAGTNENNLSFEAYSGGTTLMGGANTFAGRVNIGRATIEASVIANAGVASSLGTGSTTPEIVMHDTTSTAAVVSTLRYTGTADATTDRAVRLFTDGGTMPSLTGVIENVGAGVLKFTSPFTTAGNTTLTRVFRLSGTNTGANEIVSIGDGPSSIVSLEKTGAGAWALSGNSTYSGTTTITNGTLTLGNGGAAGMTGTGDITIGTGATLATNRSDAHTVSSTILGAGALSVGNTVTGTTTLSAANTYSGGTTVRSGTLVFTNVSGSATGTGNVNVAAPATLAGGGAIVAPAAAVTICGTLSVGEDFTVAQDMSISAASIILDSPSVSVFDLISGAGSGVLNGASSADSLIVGGTMTIEAGATLTLRNLNGLGGWSAGDAWQLFDWTTLSGVAAGAFTTLNLPVLSGLTWDTSALYTSGIISIAAVPEPGRAAFFMLFLAALLRRRRR